MKIGLQTWGSDGDINPFIALAGGLAAAGHEVTLAITAAERKDYQSYSQRLGFVLKPVAYIAKDDAAMAQLGERLWKIASPLGQVRFILQALFEPNVESLYATALELCAENELLIGHFALHPLHLAAEQAGKPYVTVSLNHGAIPSRFVPPPLMPNLGVWLNPWVWKLVEALLKKIMLPSVNRLRSREGRPALSSARPVVESPLCNLIAISPALCAKPADWGDNQHVTGFLALPEKARPWTMPDDLGEFLAAGEPPVYLTFGSMSGIDRDPATITVTTRLLVEAVQAAGCRAIIQARWDSVSSLAENPKIYRIGPVPHSQLFPHCAAIVHHGGAGTTQTSLLYGKPQIIVAHIADQYFWADALKRLGVAGKRHDRRTTTATGLGAAIRQALDSPTMVSRAASLGQQIAAEDGVATAVGIISCWHATVGALTKRDPASRSRLKTAPTDRTSVSKACFAMAALEDRNKTRTAKKNGCPKRGQTSREI
jgi:UDP:flavonoid glycosyltransferase YjiC (YdhE family)